MYEYKAKVERVVDGDTLELAIDLGFNITIRETVRLLGVDAFETKGDERPLGLAAKEFMKELLEGKEVIIETRKDDSFGRWLAKVWMSNGDYMIDVCKLLIEKGHAKPYLN